MNIRNKQTNIYERSTNTRWTNRTRVFWLTIKRWNKLQAKNIFTKEKCVHEKNEVNWIEMKWKWNVFAVAVVVHCIIMTVSISTKKRAEKKNKQHENNRVLKMMHGLTRRSPPASWHTQCELSFVEERDRGKMEL